MPKLEHHELQWGGVGWADFNDALHAPASQLHTQERRGGVDSLGWGHCVGGAGRKQEVRRRCRACKITSADPCAEHTCLCENVVHTHTVVC